MNTFRDLFSAHAADYERYRPVYPPALFAWLAEVAPDRSVAWDCGTGSGQAAVGLASHFGRVIATDASEKQLAHAVPSHGISYRVASAEVPGLAAASIDLATVAQAFHWFDAGAFFRAAAEVLVPRGVLALWTYRNARVDAAVDAVERDFYVNVVGQDWAGPRRLVEEGYASVRFPPPFEEMSAPRFELSASWTRDEFLGYVGTWSAVHAHRKRTGTDPLAPFAARITAVWSGNEKREVRWDHALRVARKVTSRATA